MKKFLLLMAVAMMATCVNAQSFFSKFDYDVEVGVGIRGANAPFDNGTFGIQRIGANATLPFKTFAKDKMDLYGTLGVMYGKKGGSLFNDFDDFGSDNKLKLTQVEIPIHVGLQYALGQKTKLFLDLGPYVGIGVGGKFGLDEEGDEEMLKNGIDVGVGANFGFKFKTFILGFGYEKGFTNAAELTIPKYFEGNDSLKEGKTYGIRSQVYYVSLRWTFLRRK